MSFKNATSLVQNDLTTYVIPLDAIKNCTVGIQTDVNNGANVVVRIDGSLDGTTWTNNISLSDPTAAIGAAYLTALTGPSKAATTQDRLFGFKAYRVVRTDGDPSTAAKFLTNIDFN
jgi:hypothetical protein